MRIAKLIKEKAFKAELIAYCQKEACWGELAELSFDEDPYLAWRALWLLSSLKAAELRSLQLDAKALIGFAAKQDDSYQRECFKVLAKLDLAEAILSEYFDWAEKLWVDIGRKASLRIMALRAMARIAKVYPILKQEILALSDSEYLDPLSPGIRHQAQALFQDLDKV